MMWYLTIQKSTERNERLLYFLFLKTWKNAFIASFTQQLAWGTIGGGKAQFPLMLSDAKSLVSFDSVLSWQTN